MASTSILPTPRVEHRATTTTVRRAPRELGERSAVSLCAKVNVSAAQTKQSGQSQRETKRDEIHDNRTSGAGESGVRIHELCVPSVGGRGAPSKIDGEENMALPPLPPPFSLRSPSLLFSPPFHSRKFLATESLVLPSALRPAAFLSSRVLHDITDYF